MGAPSARYQEDIKEENFYKVQEYFNDKYVGYSRMVFKVRRKMVEDNPERKYRRKGTDSLMCSYCGDGKLMTQNHCLDG